MTKEKIQRTEKQMPAANQENKFTFGAQIEKRLLSPTTLLLDVDGTLIESNMQHAESWYEAFSEAGHQVEFEKIRLSIGKGGDQILPSLVHLSPESPEAEAISQRRGEIFRSKFLHQLRPHTRAAELLKTVANKGYQMVIATSSEAGDLQAMLRQAGLDGIIDECTTASDSKKSKPHPDIIIAALRKADCRADQAVMIGDTPYDIEAAKLAGVAAIGFASGGWSKADLEDAGAVMVFDGCADFLSRADQIFGNWN